MLGMVDSDCGISTSGSIFSSQPPSTDRTQFERLFCSLSPRSGSRNRKKIDHKRILMARNEHTQTYGHTNTYTQTNRAKSTSEGSTTRKNKHLREDGALYDGKESMNRKLWALLTMLFVQAPVYALQIFKSPQMFYFLRRVRFRRPTHLANIFCGSTLRETVKHAS